MVARGLNYRVVRELVKQSEGTTMKRIIWVILAVFLSYGASEAHFGHIAQRGRHFGLFYSSLQAHGEWISVGFGTAWRPFHVGRQWRPYLNGRWIWTDYGWYWSSYEPFGWATYHYGRWTYDDYYGWIWIPGDVWGPAWVEWRYDDDYIGWAPLPPSARWSFSVGITFGQTWIAPVHYWNFVPCGNFSSVSVVNYIQPPDISRRIFGRTRPAGSVRAERDRIVNDAVRLDRVQRHTRERIPKIGLTDRSSPGEDRLVRGKDRETLEIYRPDPGKTGSRDSRRPPDMKGSGERPRVNDADRGSRTGRVGPTGRTVQPGQNAGTDRKGISNPGAATPGRKIEPRQQSGTRVAPKRGGQRSLEESKSMRIQRDTRSGDRNQSRTVTPQVQKRPTVTKQQRPEVKRSAPSNGRSGSGKRKPDG